MTCGWHRGLLVVAAVGLVAGLAQHTAASVTHPRQPHLLQAHAPQHRPAPAGVPGQVIVKYTGSVTACVHCVLQQRKSFRAATTDASDSLDRLDSRYHVRGARALFRSDAEERRLQHGRPVPAAELNQQQHRWITAAQTAFAARAGRVANSAGAPDLSQVYVLDIDPTASVAEAVAAFQHDPHVAYAQPNYIVQPLFVPNDPYYGSAGSWGQSYDDLWGLKPGKMNLAAAWDVTQGAGAVVAVVDTGVDSTHPDIAANIWTNPGEIPGNGIDDDRNGFVDDTKGWDFANSDNDPKDGNGHGTHVAGTIAAVGNNSLGIVGVAPKAKIMALKGLSDGGSGTIDGLAAAIVYAAKNGADVINNSWGCSSQCPSNPIAEDAVRTAQSLGAIVVFAAGNSADEVALYSPNNMTDSKPLVVSASTETDGLAFFSNVGKLVDVAAPGGGTNTPPPSTDPFRNILSLKSSVCDPGLCPPSLVVGGNYVRQAGTSMAAPHVSGLMALLVAAQPTATIAQLKKRLYGNAVDLGAAGADSQFGFGRIQAAAALTDSQTYLLARITSPGANSSFGGQVIIRGTAAAKKFSRYDIFVGQGSNPSTWQTTGMALTGGEIVEGQLATWNTTSLANGLWTIRLVVSDTVGGTREDRTAMTIDNAYQAGWPQATSGGHGSYHSTLVTADLDGDGTQEVIAGSQEGLLYVWRQNGQLMPGFPVAAASYGGETLTPAVGNLDSDPQLEIVVGSNGTHPNGQYPDLFVFNHDGTPVAGWPKISANYLSDPPTIADLDGDGSPEILLGEEDQQVHAYHANGQPVAGWPVPVDHGQGVSGIAVGDLDGDGDVEIVAANDNYLYAWHHNDLNADGKADRVAGWPVAVTPPTTGYNETIFMAPALGDIDGNGTLDVVAAAGEKTASGMDYQVFAWNGNGTVIPGWPRIVGGTVQWGAVALGDIDGDGVPEVVITGEDGNVWAWKGSGAVVTGFPASLGGDLSSGLSAAIADIDGDGFNDIITGVSNGIVILDHTGTVKAGWPKAVDVDVAPAIADLDGDGDLEVVAYGEYPDTRVYVWDVADPASPLGLAWPMLGQNAQHTGRSQSVCAVAAASFNASLQAPSCATTACGCDTGGLVDSRGTIGGKAEVNQPNTLGGSCQDGTTGTYHLDESIDRLTVKSVDGGLLQPGAAARVNATVWCWGTADLLDLYYASNASAPSWTPIATGLACPAGQLSVTFSRTLTLASAAGQQAVRAQFRYGGAASSCTSGAYNDHDDVVFTVGGGNRAPVLSTIGNQSVAEGQRLSFTVSATDPDNDSLSYSATSLPTGATFTASTRTFSWTPGFTQSGSYQVTFKASDPGGLADTETISITVTNVNRPPVLNPIGSKTVAEGQPLTLTISATDPDGDTLSYTASPLPTGATFDPSTRTLSWTPGVGKAGNYSVKFVASDAESFDDETVIITVTKATTFQESAGQVVMETDHYDGKVSRNGKDWVFQTSRTGFSGSGYLISSPNTGVTYNTGYLTNSPELIYRVKFTTTGTYAVWVRGVGPTGNDDSLHAGVDGTGPSSADRISGFSTTNWSWTRSTMDGPVATVVVATPGIHTIHLWMREDGLLADKLLLRTNSSSTPPSGAGPAESPRS